MYLLAIIAMLTLACSKDNTVKHSTLTATALADASDLTGYAACHATYVATINNPPEGYIPGDAEIALSQCIDALIQTNPGSHPVEEWEPPTNIILDPGTPTSNPSNSGCDNTRVDDFFGLSYVSANNTAQQMQDAEDLFVRYSTMICEAVSAYLAANPGATLAYYQKPDVITQWAAQNPTQFTSTDDRDKFIRFAAMIFLYEHFTICVGPNTIATPVSPFQSDYSSCINLVTHAFL